MYQTKDSQCLSSLCDIEPEVSSIKPPKTLSPITNDETRLTLLLHIYSLVGAGPTIDSKNSPDIMQMLVTKICLLLLTTHQTVYTRNTQLQPPSPCRPGKHTPSTTIAMCICFSSCSCPTCSTLLHLRSLHHEQRTVKEVGLLQ